MSNKIFEEAIADAKKLREVAEANAKKVVLEAVTPKIKEFIESELLEEKVEEKEEVLEEITLDESALIKLSHLLGINENLSLESKENSKIISEATEQAYEAMTPGQQEELNIIVNKIKESKRTLTEADISNKESNLKENSKMSEKFYEVDLKALREAIETELSEVLQDEGSYMEEAEEEVDEDSSLEAMLQELKLVLDLGDDIEEDQVPEELRGMIEEEEEEGASDEELEMEDEESPEAEEAPADAEELPDLDMPADMEEMVEVDEMELAEEIIRLRKLVREGKMDHHFGGKGAGKAGVDGAFGGKGAGKAGVNKSFGGGAEGQDAFANPPAINKLAEAYRDERRKNRALDEKLKKYRSAIDTLREQLEDLNLFNAKLLYVNKLLQNKSLNESEKKSAIKALDEANSLREAKSLYKSLTETFARGKGKTLTESHTRGSSSRTTTSAASKNSPPELDRWQRLAGLK